MIRKFQIFVILLSVLSFKTDAAILNGHAFLEKLNSNDPADLAVSVGYIAAVIDTWNNRKEPAYQDRCFSIPPGVSPVDLMPVVKYYLQGVPASLDYTASYLVWMALATQYRSADCYD